MPRLSIRASLQASVMPVPDAIRLKAYLRAGRYFSDFREIISMSAIIAQVLTLITSAWNNKFTEAIRTGETDMTLKEINKRLNGLESDFQDLLSAAQSLANAVREIADEQREAFDNMPEGLQTSEKGEISEARAEALETLADELDDVIASIEGINMEVE